MTDRKAEISVMVDEINATERALAAKGIMGLGTDDRAEALEIIDRIERRMLANMPASEAAE